MLKHTGLALSLVVIGAASAQADAFRLDAAQMDAVSAGSSLAWANAESLALASDDELGTFTKAAVNTTTESDTATSAAHALAVTESGYTLAQVDGLVVTDDSGLLAGGGAEAVSLDSSATAESSLWLKAESNEAVAVTIGRVYTFASGDAYSNTFTYAEPIGDPMVYVEVDITRQTDYVSRSFLIAVSVDRK